MYSWNGLTLDLAIRRRMKKLLAVFVAASLYFTVVFHLTNLYFAKQWDYEQFILLDGGIFTALFWVGQVFIGAILPLSLLFIHRSAGQHAVSFSVLAPLFVVIGGLCQMYVTIIGGQAFPLILFPGHEVHSSFYDGVVHAYNPGIYEWLLGFGGIGITFTLTVVAVRVFKFLPQDDFKTMSISAD